MQVNYCSYIIQHIGWVIACKHHNGALSPKFCLIFSVFFFFVLENNVCILTSIYTGIYLLSL